MKRYLKRTWKNKLVALVLLMVSTIPIWFDRDATMFVLMLMIAIPLFFAKENHVGEDGRDD